MAIHFAAHYLVASFQGNDGSITLDLPSDSVSPDNPAPKPITKLKKLLAERTEALDAWNKAKSEQSAHANFDAADAAYAAEKYPEPVTAPEVEPAPAPASETDNKVVEVEVTQEGSEGFDNDASAIVEFGNQVSPSGEIRPAVGQVLWLAVGLFTYSIK